MSRGALGAAVALVSLVLSASTVANAEPPGPSAATPAGVAPSLLETQERRGPAYGFELGIPDAASFVLGGAAIATAAGARGDTAAPLVLAATSIGTYALGAPIVHLANGYEVRALVDLGVRVAAPAILGFGATGVLCASQGCGGDWGASWALAFGLGIGGGVGALSAIVFDHFVIPSDRSSRWTARWDGRPVVRPDVLAVPGGAGVGVGGAF